MGKAAAVMAMVFMAGGGVMTVLSAMGGAWSEAAALAIVGLGMLGTSHVLGAASKAKHVQPLAHPLAERTATTDAH